MSDNSTIPNSYCPKCFSEYQRGFREGHMNGEVSEEGLTCKELEEKLRLAEDKIKGLEDALKMKGLGR